MHASLVSAQQAGHSNGFSINLARRAVLGLLIAALAILAIEPDIIPSYFRDDSDTLLSYVEASGITADIGAEAFYRSIAYVAFLGPAGPNSLR